MNNTRTLGIPFPEYVETKPIDLTKNKLVQIGDKKYVVSIKDFKKRCRQILRDTVNFAMNDDNHIFL